MFLLVIANTQLIEINGISSAGANKELIPYTAVLDAEYLWYRQVISKEFIPVDPQGHPSPVVITRACYELANFPLLIANAGVFNKPDIPIININETPGKRIDKEDGVTNVKEIFEKSIKIGKELSKIVNHLYIAESVPGGTTTAMAILKALGYPYKTSSSGPTNPINIKQKIVEQAFKRKNIKEASLIKKPLKAIKYFGDPMIATVCGISVGFNKRITLCGGTQMLAVAGLLKALKFDIKRTEVATTKYVAYDKNAEFFKTAQAIGIKTEVAMIDFSKSRFKGLSDYEKGYIKEGVGAGGAFIYAQRSGILKDDIIKHTEFLYKKLNEKSLNI